MLNNKKGETLVEVIVSLGIFAFIFIGVVNIIASSITLNLSARQRTEVVSKVQKGLNEYLAGNTNLGACTISGKSVAPIVTGTIIGDSGCSDSGKVNNSTKTCYWVELKNLETVESNIALGLKSPEFIKVISHGKWYTRILGEQSFEISRVIRNN